MATIVGAAGDDWEPWLPSPAFKAMLKSLNSINRQYASQLAQMRYVNTPAIPRLQEQMLQSLNPVLEQSRRAIDSVTATSLAQNQHLSSVLQSIGQSALREFNASAMQSISASLMPLQLSQTEMLRSVNALRENPAFRLKFSSPTFDIASRLLEDADFNEVTDEVSADPADLSQDDVDELEGAIRAFAPSTDGMPPAAARACAVYFMATVAFLLYIQYSIVYPDIFSIPGNAGMTGFVAAMGAAKVTGYLWDKLFPSADDDEPPTEE
ncbi:hypothetical protein ABT052_46990 [Streptomyces sp. NPDC002766]|uniref:hypothetical protein n=1 Tax=Streptomyces sp. NPDC002766 TaxID=3154429 RepID=UPI0033293371